MLVWGTSYRPVSVSMFVTSQCSIDMDEQTDLVLARRILSTSPTLCCKEIQVSTKTRILPSGTFS